MAQFVFGSGVLYGTPLSDASGSAITTPTPVQFGTLQSGSIDISFDVKELYGNKQFPVAIGRGKGKIAGKATTAQLNGTLINSLFFGQTQSSGISAVYTDTTGAAIAATVTPTVPSSGTWTEDLGVINQSTGVALTRVASAPATGQYSVSAGTYTFASADVGIMVYINFRYTATSTTASKISVANLPMGYAPTFKAVFSVPYNGKLAELVIPMATSTKLTLATKLDDFAVPEFDFAGLADSAGNVLYLNTTDK